MKTKTRMLLAGTTATVVLAVAGVGTAVTLDSDDSRPDRRPAVVEEAPVVDAGPNAWAANDCTLLREVYGESAAAYGC